jgi:hypothetical protein
LGGGEGRRGECGKIERTHDESLVNFDSFVSRVGDGVFVNIFEIRGAKSFGKGGRYDFGRETLHEPQLK